MANSINHIPYHTQYSLNIRGLVDNNNMHVKLRFLSRQFRRTQHVGCVHFQETHFKTETEARACFNKLGGFITGFVPSTYRGMGLLTWVPRDSPIYHIMQQSEHDQRGRWSMLQISAREEVLHILNLYAPASGKTDREEFFERIKLDFEDYENLVMVGDWNFVTESLDYMGPEGLIEPEYHPKACEFLAHYSMQDLYRTYDAQGRAFTHCQNERFKRLDRFYVSAHMMHEFLPMPNIPTGTTSDHEAVGMQFGAKPRCEEKINPYYRMSRSLITLLGNPDSRVRVNTECWIYNCFIKMNVAETQDPENKEAILAIYNDFKWSLVKYYARLDRKYTRRKMRRRWRERSLPSLDKVDYTQNPAEAVTNKIEELRKYDNDMEKEARNHKLRTAFNWLRDSEGCNKLFFQTTRMREKSNEMPHIRKLDGTITTTVEEKLDEVARSYASTFTKRLPDPQAMGLVVDAIKETDRGMTDSDKWGLQNLLDLKLQDVENPDEHSHKCWVYKTILTLKMYKSPGPDGIPNEFYYILKENKQLRSILSRVFQAALTLNRLPFTMRETYYKLLFKKGNYDLVDLDSGKLDGAPNDPRSLANYRPIALICCDAKILSAYTAAQLKEYTKDVVSPTQSAFVPGRQIHDNIMLVQQIIHHHNTVAAPAGLLFLDYAHAYDYISQEYVLTVLQALNMPGALINIVATLMAGQIGSAIVNLNLTKPFKVDNGGKQGDPLFPLIYVLAMEGFVALLHSNENAYRGLLTPYGETYISVVGYADDTVIAIGSEDDAEALPAILETFTRASGNEIKTSKSYIMWLGGFSPTLNILGIPALAEGETERYLGINIGHNFDPVPMWDKLLESMPNRPEYWASFGISAFGRVLLLNACLLSTIWYLAHHARIPNKQLKKIEQVVDNYFRRGKRANSIRKSKRYLPKKLGGLGLLDIKQQVNNLLGKWVIKHLANDPHPWNIYWNENTRMLQDVLECPTHPALTSKDLKCYMKCTKIFHVVVPAYYAWQQINLDLNKSYEHVLSMPLFYNRYVTNEGKAVAYQQGDESALSDLQPEHQRMQLRMLVTETGYPGDYDWENPETHKVRLKTPTELQLEFPVRVSDFWSSILSRIPVQVVKVLAAGPTKYGASSTRGGWVATSENAADPSEIGYMYYVSTSQTQGSEVELHHFNPKLLDYSYNLDQSILILSYNCSNKQNDDPEDWADWRDTLNTVRPLAVSFLTSVPVLIGWADEELSPHHFLRPNMKQKGKQKSIEFAIGKQFYDLLDNSELEIKPKVSMNSTFRSIRYSKYEKLNALDQWEPSREEIAAHAKVGRLDPPGISWSKRMKTIHSCNFMLNKYSQLIYWVTTDSLPCGSQLHHYSPRGLCPHCGAVASAKHIFSRCVLTRRYLSLVNKLGAAHWEQYEDFEYNEIPVLLSKYTPIKQYHISALWALWKLWAEYFFDKESTLGETSPNEQVRWLKEAIKNLHLEYVKRIYELAAISQWLVISKNRGSTREKQFLLVEIHKVDTNSSVISEEMVNDLQSWIGREYLVKVDRFYHRPRLKIQHAIWTEVISSLGGEIPLGPSPLGPDYAS